MSRKTRNDKARKPRIEQLYGTTADNVREIVVRVNEATGEIEFGQPMVNVYSQVSYDRPKGEKVLTRVPQGASTLSFDIQRALLANFEYTVAVDTNSRTINGRSVSVTAVVAFEEAPPPPGASAHWRLDVPFCWEFIDLRTEKIENFGWLAAYEQLIAGGQISAGTRVGMIVDSDLGNIPKFNTRSAPFFEDRYLPPGVQLVYASADSGSENVVNRVLQTADSVSTQALDAIGRGDVEFNRCDKAARWYAGHRKINPIAKIYDLWF
ncbi:hypothetical protein ELG79_09130 [Rhizobium leguminosarum]|uniref:hypothetical protein n=1 Tax=Rhizobium leguminosarum TaxID=384 RepID=UPI00102FEB07|nr:hypothetical protein [Rhizobium leguminosarum]TBG25403.1 hypothetical protein ELG79_09130 [Rhizobium leguminosarum]